MNFKEIIQSNNAVLVDFYADWCGPCKTQTPILKSLKAKLGDRIKVIKIDVDKNQSLSRSYQVSGVPTLLLFKDGSLVWRKSGVSSQMELEQQIQKLKV
jgi:thioredoxin 1